MIYGLIFPFLLLIIITYPSSPVLFLTLFENNKEVYIIYLLIILLFTLLVKKETYSTRKDKVHIYILLYFISIGFVYLCTIINSNTGVVQRDLFTLCVLLIMYIKLTGKIFIKIFQNMIFIFCIILYISFIVSLLLVLNIINLDVWNAANLSLYDNNPIVSRYKYGDFIYYFPYYFAVVPTSEYAPQNLFGIAFNRLPFIFTESTYTWSYIAPYFLVVVIDKRFKNRNFCLLIFSLCLLFSFSNYGLILGFGIFILYYICRKMNSTKAVFFIISIFIVFYSILPINFINIALPNKAGQFLSIQESINYIQISPSLFGQNLENLDIFSYGSTVNFLRYGIFGGAVYLCWILILSIWSLSMFVKSNKRSLFLPIIFMVFFFMKIPIMALYTGVLIIIYYRSKNLL